MAISEGLNSIISFIKRGFEKEDEFFEGFGEDEYTEEYAADGNAALDVMYSPKAESRWNPDKFCAKGRSNRRNMG